MTLGTWSMEFAFARFPAVPGKELSLAPRRDLLRACRFFLSDAEHGTVMPSRSTLDRAHCIGLGGAIRRRDLSAAGKLHNGLRYWNAIEKHLNMS